MLRVCNLYILLGIENNEKQVIMNQYTEILTKAATNLGLEFQVTQSGKSEAAYLLIKDHARSNFNDVYSCLSVRLASHDAMTSRSADYAIQLDCGFNFDYELNTFETKWGLDSDGDFSETELEDELVFKNETEIIDYMANCLKAYLKSKLN